MLVGPADEQLCDVVLRDGSTLGLRSVRQTDVAALIAFFEALSPESRYFRFFGVPHLDQSSIARLIPVSSGMGTALVGECGGRIVAFAGYYRTGGERDRAEVAFAIADGLQGRGLGTRLLERLADLARSENIRTFDAFVMTANRKMMDVFLDSGYRVLRRIDGGVFHVELSVEPTPDYVEKAAWRSQLAATASMKAFFEPRTVAVVGANRERGKIGAEILHNLQGAGFTGRVFPVHPVAEHIQGLRAYARVSDIPDAVDLAVIVVPACPSAAPAPLSGDTVVATEKSTNAPGLRSIGDLCPRAMHRRAEVLWTSGPNMGPEPSREGVSVGHPQNLSCAFTTI